MWALVGIVAVSFSAIFIRLADLPPTTAAFFRAAYALPFLAAIYLLDRTADRRRFDERLWAVGAGVALGIDFTLWHRAIDAIGAGLATVLGNTQVVFVGFAAWALWGERPTRAARATVPFVFLGVVLISGLGRADAYGASPLRGTLYGIATGLSYCVFLLALRHANRRQAPAVGPLLDATAGAAAASVVIGLFDHGLVFTPSWPGHGWMLVIAIVSQTVGWLLITHALSRLPALEMSVMLLLQPSLTVFWGLLLFDERLSFLQWGGVALVIGGIGWLSVKGTVEPPTDTAGPSTASTA